MWHQRKLGKFRCAHRTRALLIPGELQASRAARGGVKASSCHLNTSVPKGWPEQGVS